MNFRQDEEHQDILEMVHDFAVNEVKPLAAEIDRRVPNEECQNDG